MLCERGSSKQRHKSGSSKAPHVKKVSDREERIIASSIVLDSMRCCLTSEGYPVTGEAVQFDELEWMDTQLADTFLLEKSSYRKIITFNLYGNFVVWPEIAPLGITLL